MRLKIEKISIYLVIRCSFQGRVILIWVVVSNILYVHPDPRRKYPIWRTYFSNGWFIHQPEMDCSHPNTSEVDGLSLSLGSTFSQQWLAIRILTPKWRHFEGPQNTTEIQKLFHPADSKGDVFLEKKCCGWKTNGFYGSIYQKFLI